MALIEASLSSPEEKIKALIRLQIHIALNDKSSVTVFNDEWRHLQEPYLSEFLELRRTYEKSYLRIIREGIQKGVLKEVDTYIMYQLILSSLRWLHMPNLKKSKMNEEEMTEQITSLLIKGILV